ncbi:uncharacterized protein LOC131478524 [Ochotona princeps]|uniref:uncharacterized protein LOC131478524 n=1 Tax=Ochotona princeps TaxID=9978 RepID=UPI00271485E5|nr:uncharacterized protein LOC131478524 [Ochotona princeps]XP_058514635.1 uncharacterized protein LOC131478524 [Ochotona princeps]XP_058514636.1 uncharacterized protein LOC131478524 [Ochotona princeps]
MEKDVLAHNMVQTTQAGDTAPTEATTGTEAPPLAQTALQDAPSTANPGINVGHKSMGQEEKAESGRKSHVSLSVNVPDVALIHVTSETPSSVGDSGENVGKKSSRKRRNKKEGKILYLPWSLMLHSRTTSVSHSLGQKCTSQDMPHTGERLKSKSGAKDTASVLTQPWESLAGTLLPATNPVQPSLSKNFLRYNEKIKVGHKGSLMDKDEERTKVVASPWPLTVQAWASFTGPAPGQPRASEVSEIQQKSNSPKGEQARAANLTSRANAKAGVTSSSWALGQTSRERTYPTGKSRENMEGPSRLGRGGRRNKSAHRHLWPLTVQAWASFAAAPPVQTHPQKEPPAAKTNVNVEWGSQTHPTGEGDTTTFLPWSSGAQTSSCLPATARLHTLFGGTPFLELSKIREMIKKGDEQHWQSSAEPTPQSCQGWKTEERGPGDHDCWGRVVRNLPRQADAYYYGEFYSRERSYHGTSTETHSHMDTLGMGMQRRERERTESQTTWMKK